MAHGHKPVISADIIALGLQAYTRPIVLGLTGQSGLLAIEANKPGLISHIKWLMALVMWDFRPVGPIARWASQAYKLRLITQAYSPLWPVAMWTRPMP